YSTVSHLCYYQRPHSCSAIRFSYVFYSNIATTIYIYTLSLHDALPISVLVNALVIDPPRRLLQHVDLLTGRSEEHTSELQSRFDLVCRLLLEKKKKKKKTKKKTTKLI